MSEAVLTMQGKADVLTDYAARYPRRVLIETGLWEGWGTGMRIDRTALGIELYAVIDFDPVNCEKAEALETGAAVWCGDSGEMMPFVLRYLDVPAIFWLDAHLNEEYDGRQERMCPLLDELAAIRAWPHAAESVVLIDDIRLFGEPGWPTREELATLLHVDVQPPRWWVEESADILRCTPSR